MTFNYDVAVPPERGAISDCSSFRWDRNIIVESHRFLSYFLGLYQKTKKGGGIYDRT